jgi:pimeloyl-ACP methyl ester carboxylesterase
VLRGERSDVLSADPAGKMQARGPRARLVAFAGVGHAPWLMDEAQLAPVRDFLLTT